MIEIKDVNFFMEWGDALTEPLLRMMNNIDQMVAVVEKASEHTTQAFTGIKDSLSRMIFPKTNAEAAMPNLPDPSSGLFPATISWQSPDPIQLFLDDGLVRYQQEMASVNELLAQVNLSQQKIRNTASQVDIFSGEMGQDIQTLDAGIKQITAQINALSNQTVDDLGAEAVNQQLEVLRNHLNQAVKVQNHLVSAMGDMDISTANEDFKQLSDRVNATTAHIRDHLKIQQQLNDEVEKGGDLVGGFQQKMLGVVSEYANLESLGKLLDLSDQMTETTARLTRMNDGFQSTTALQNKMFASAERTGISYTAMIDMVEQLNSSSGLSFGSNDEAILMAENLNKLFMLAGVSQKDLASAAAQFTATLGDGVLQGEDFEGMLSATPEMIQLISDYLGVSVEEMGELASQGQITADHVKNGLLSATDQINDQFSEWPATWAQIWTRVKDNLLMSFMPLIELVASGAEWIMDNWSILEPIFWGLSAAIAFFTLAAAFSTAQTWLMNTSLKALFATLMANPLLAIALAIGVLVAGLIYWIQSVGGLKIAWLIAMDVLKTSWDIVCIGLTSGFYWLMDLFTRFQMVFATLATAMTNLMGDMKTGILLILQSLINRAIGLLNQFIGTVNKIPGVALEPIQSVAFGTQAIIDNQREKAERNNGWVREMQGLGEEIDQRKEALSQLKQDAFDALSQRQNEIYLLQSQARAEEGIPSVEVPNAGGVQMGISNIAPARMGEPSGSSVDATHMEDEEIDYLQRLAEQETVNRFTTAEINIDMPINANIHSQMDLDGVVSHLADRVNEAMEKTAEGVHD